MSHLNPNSHPKIIRGIWQLASGHQVTEPSSSLLEPILDSVSCGFNTFDCADIYTGAEQLLGEARIHCGKESIRVHTKYVPDLDQLSYLNFSKTAKIIERSLKRLKADSLDLVQFHWWDYRQPYYLETLYDLERLKIEGKIKKIGLTNFDAVRLQEVLNAGFSITSIQLQASLLDKRGQSVIQSLCRKHGIQRLAYGSLLGGFLSTKWIAKTEPTLDQLVNRSLIKYKLLIDDWGGWERFQSFLVFLSRFSQKYDASLSQVAMHAVLQSELADVLIIGLSPMNYQEHNRKLQKNLVIEDQDLKALLSWDSPLTGDVYDLERLPKHGSIMRYHLNSIGEPTLCDKK